MRKNWTNIEEVLAPALAYLEYLSGIEELIARSVTQVGNRNKYKHLQGWKKLL